ncbi:MAG TPA: primosomal protein N' [Candidatus Acidoferrum sp.]|nr:primosomal protein N' [Candidatus Acidoferrum sp.]
MERDHASSTDSAAPAAVALVSVLLPLPLVGAYDYRTAADLRLERGDFVVVPLGKREVIGVVWGEGRGDVGRAKLRDVIARLEAPPLPEVLCRFVEWVAQYTMSPAGAVLAMAMRVPAALEPPRGIAAWRRSDDTALLAGLRLTPERQRVLDVLADGPPRPTAELAREAGVGVGVVKALAAARALLQVELPPPPAFERPDPECAGPTLSAAQADAASALANKVASGGFSVTALDGVTGAGKTEVYFEAVAQALRGGRQALVLLPEIALGAQWLDRFTARFGVRPAQWHSDLTMAERRVAWRAIARGEARVVVGARSALFLPYPELGLIVVDEEHDAAYKQEDGVIYQARDMAVVRARLTDIPIVLVSATPSLETVQNVTSGRYAALHLPDRHGGAQLPLISAIDLRADKPPRQSWLSPTLRQALSETLAAGEQALLFLNRRGYAPLTLCRACGHRLQCPRCTAWLVEHRLVGRLQCHHCGFQVPFPTSCPSCKAEGMLAACGPGVERLSEEVAALLPAARTAMMTSDTITGPLAATELIRRVQDHAVDLLIGTQMIAKGHHFPMLTLVGVVDADLGLHGGDLRAAERTYQLLHQVAGRAGRADRPGRVLLQTFEPDHPVMQALVAGDRDRFLASEAADRRSAGMPPFGRLAALILAGPEAETVDGAARTLARTAPRGDGVEVLGPAPAPLAILRGRHRRRFLLKCRRDIAPQPLLRSWLGPVKLPASVRLQIDIDPYSFL